MPVRLDARAPQTLAYRKHYLLYTREDKLPILWGPFEGEDIVSRWYDLFGEKLKREGHLDSIALLDKEIERKFPDGVIDFDEKFWLELLEKEQAHAEHTGIPVRFDADQEGDDTTSLG